VRRTIHAAVLCLVLFWPAAGLCGGVETRRPAFPGAEGYGEAAIGGRGGKIIHVTTLTSTGPGSLAEACAAEGPRIVVFDVAGVIKAPLAGKGRRRLYIKHGNLTIAGQTAPGKGITIEGALRTVGKDVNDIVIRFIRLRPDCYAPAFRPVAHNNADCVGINYCQRAILDHCTVSWGNDECVDLINSKYVTLQWCTVEESDIQWEGGDEPHNFAIIVGYTGGCYSIHHNLVAHHHSRAPAFTALKQELDYRNNVMYNFGTSTSSGFGNVIGNIAKAGPGAPWAFPRIYYPPATLTLPDISPYKRGGTFLRGNYRSWAGGYVDLPTTKYRTKAQPVPAASVTTHVAEEAYDLVLAHAGCLPRDEVSARTIHEVRTGTGSWGRHDPPGDWRERLAGGTPPKDTDRDGMPDDWETAHKLDPNDLKDANKIVPPGVSKGNRHSGCTYIEFYINERADSLIAEAMTQARHRTGPGDPPPKPDLEKPFKPVAELVRDVTSQSMKRKQKDTTASFYAIQNLGRIGHAAKAAVPALAAALKTDDKRTAVFAAWAIGAIGPHARDAVPALIKALEKPFPVQNSKWQFNPHGFIAWALGRIGPNAKAAVPALAKALHGPDTWARRPAAWALAQIGSDARPAIDALVRALAGQSGGAWSAVYNTQIHAAEALANIGEPAVPALLAALDVKDAATRRGAAMALGGIGPKAALSAVPALVRRVSDKDKLVRLEALAALAKISPSAAARAAEPLAADKDYAVRHAVANALGGGAPGAALAKLLNDPRREVRRAAFDSLRRIGPRSIPMLSAALVDKADPWARRHAARALGGAGATAVPPLVKALSDSDALVRREAAWSLGEIGEPAGEAAKALLRAKDDGDFVVRVAAADALRRIRGASAAP